MYLVKRYGAVTGRLILVGVIALGLSACAGTYRNYGYVPPQEDLDLIAIGVDTRSTVEETLGSAAAASATGDDAMFFIRTRVHTVAMFEPEVVERNVVAVSFDDNDIVRNIETFDLEDGQVVRLSRRVTDSSVGGRSVLGQLLSNIGNFTPGGIQ